MMRLIKTTGWLAMAAAIIFGTAACSSSDDSIAEQQPANPTGKYTMTINASKDGDAQTRGLYYGDADAQGKKPLNVKWNEGEKVEVVQGSATLGTLTATPDSSDPTKATLSGTLTSSPADDQPILFALHGAQADYTGQKGILLKTDGDDSIEENYDYAACQVEKDKFTIDTDAKTVSVPDGITLISAQAIVKFSLYKSDGITPINATSFAISSSPSVFATVYKISTHYVENSITCGNIELTGLSGTTNDIYVALCTIFSANAGITLTATDASGNTYTYTKSGVTFAIGQYYEVKVKMTRQAALGDLFYSDGTFSSTLVAGKTPIGVIAYLDQPGTDDDEITEKSQGAGHGLVMCLKNAEIDSEVPWSTERVSKFLGQEVTSVDGLKRTTNVSGYTNTATLTVDAATAEKYPVAKAAKEYTTLAAPTGTTGWFLPSAQQWVKMIEGLGGLSDGAPNFAESWFDNNHTAADKWEAALSKAGSSNYDSMTSTYSYYWSSSEISANKAVGLDTRVLSTGESFGFNWSYGDKFYVSVYVRVRPVLAF